ncbi:MAG: sodium:solute symporter [Chitinophagales bacterium]
MSGPDWIVLTMTLLVILIYGLNKSRTSKNLDGYFRSSRIVPWWIVLFSIMGTQASAVTFLSAPGQAYTDGMRFVEFYFGLPLAMIFLCTFFVPVFRKMNLFTAYEFLEKRFDVKTRTFTSLLFLLSRGISTGISISAPSIILSSLLHWDIFWTNIFMGGLLIIYTVAGGAKAVAYTQQLQLIIIFGGMIMAGYMVIHKLPENVGLLDALHVGGKAGKLNVISSGFKGDHFNWNDHYNLWSGLIAGFFFQLSYFGTDQSQVGRYLAAKSTSESKLGLLMNGLVKIPMQFFILLIGVLVFSFYQFHKEPLFFNQSQLELLSKSKYKDSLVLLEQAHDRLQDQKLNQINLVAANASPQTGIDWEEERGKIQESEQKKNELRATVKRWLKDKDVDGNDNDTNYIFLRFVVDYLPKGLIGLLIAVIFLAAWGSIAAALNSLASCSIIDFQKRFSKKPYSQRQEYRFSQWYTFLWGVFCIAVAQVAYNFGNSLIEAVNRLGSIFYGTILGIFLVAFFVKKVGAGAVFISSIIVEALVILTHVLTQKGIIELSYLWLTLFGAVGVVLLSWIINPLFKKATTAA